MVPIVEKAKEIAFQLFDEAYATEKRKTFHFATIWKRSKLLAIGQNKPNVESHTAMRFAKRFGNDTKFNYVHAEVNAIAKLWGRQHIGCDMKMVVLRVNSWGQLQNSKPCSKCQTILDALSIRRIYYSTKSGEVECSV